MTNSTQANIKTIENKLSAARTKLILDKPFLGAITLQLPLIAASDSWCKTTATDAKNIYYNPKYIDKLTTQQTQFILSHDALHCALSHFHRRQHRDKHRWDIACDFAVNSLLVDEGLEPPPAALYNPVFRGMTAEEIYPSIEENCKDETLDQHVFDKHNEPSTKSQHQPVQQEINKRESHGEQDRQKQQPSPQQAEQQNIPQGLSPTEKEELNKQWQQRLAAAAQQARMANKLSEALSRIVEVSIKSKQSWRQILARHMSSFARDDYSYARPSNRREGPAIFPSLRSQQINVIVAIDSSGSIKDEEISEFVAEVNAIKGQARARITLLACDKKLDPNSPWIFEPWEEFQFPAKLRGGGGTDFTPVFDWIQQQDSAADIIVYFTDGKGKFPKEPPSVPVLWLIKGKANVPWGQRILLT